MTKEVDPELQDNTDDWYSHPQTRAIRKATIERLARQRSVFMASAKASSDPVVREALAGLEQLTATLAILEKKSNG